MTLNEKIKKLRKARGLTQAELCGDKITRNMLSAIESGKALPSLETLKYIAQGLGVTPAYLLSEDDDTALSERKALIEKLRALLVQKKYAECLSEANLLFDTADDEISYIAAMCCFEIGCNMFWGGSLTSAASYFEQCLALSEQTVYDTRLYKVSSVLYLAVCKNVNAPLLELSEDEYKRNLIALTDIDFYKYLIKDSDFDFGNTQYALHLSAKQKIKERRYADAVSILTELELTKGDYPPNAFLMFGVYSDLEICYKQLFDFENAYRYSSKRISMLEGFGS